MQAMDIMTREVKTIAPNATIEEAIGILLNTRVSGMPVTDAEGRLVGVVSEGDFLHASETRLSQAQAALDRIPARPRRQDRRIRRAQPRAQGAVT